MALVNLAGLLNHARQHGYGVGAFNVPDYETLQAILLVAVEKQSPVIVDVAEVHLKYICLDEVAYVVRRAAERAPVPVALHLDHGENFETIMRAVRAGFTSVMFDGSHLPYEENVAQTSDIVRICHAMGVTVEAELGQVLGGEGTSERFEADPSLFTDPVQAEDFVKRTQIDAIAISFGTAHGLYRGTPKLDFARLDDIARRTRIPVVLHGGTGVADEDFRRAISLGIAKINYYTQLSVAAVECSRKTLQANPELVSYPQLLKAAREGIKQVISHQMDVFGSAGVCERFPDICVECDLCFPPNAPLVERESAVPTPSSESSSGLSESDIRELVEAVTQAVVKGLQR
jgi:fructose-bisphosphate aldolase class II